VEGFGVFYMHLGSYVNGLAFLELSVTIFWAKIERKLYYGEGRGNLVYV